MRSRQLIGTPSSSGWLKTIAEERGLLATFMPKPFTNLTGNGAHFHMSLWDAENQQNLFLDENDRNGLSPTCLLVHRRDSQTCTSGYGGHKSTRE